MIYALLIALALAAATFGGVWGARLDEPLWSGAVVIIVGTVVAGLIPGLAERPDDVPAGQYREGVIACALALGSIPAAAYFTLGFVLSRHPRWLTAAWVVSLAPLAAYAVYVWIFVVIGRIDCAPDAYECPF